MAFFAQRTINSFQGGSENEMRIMIAELLGMKSHFSGENFHYLFIIDLVHFIDKLTKSTNEKDSFDDSDSISSQLSFLKLRQIILLI